jgi:GH15 family glucan-1,4-alpha-glucosidase
MRTRRDDEHDGSTVAVSGPGRHPRYPPIGDYAVIGDCHSGALVSRQGSIDWCCMRRLDAGSVFGRLLDWDRGGSCSLQPVGEYEVTRSYVDDTLVLETIFHTATGDVRLLDFFAMREGGRDAPRCQLLRTAEGMRGSVELHLSISPRFDYGGVKPWLRQHAQRCFSSVGGNDALVYSCDADLEPVDSHDLAVTFTIRAGERVRLSIESVRPEALDSEPPHPPTSTDLDDRLDETVAWWKRWVEHVSFDGPDSGGVRRSAIVLKALTNAPTGAIAAAVTTSLPESMGGTCNWDYRYSWIRDSQFTARSLAEIGCVTGADGFRRFVERSAASDSASLQIMYGIGGERRLTETTLDLAGYRDSRPVRIGNAAAGQRQLDVYGELLELAWRWHERGHSPDDDYWRFLTSLVDSAAELWEQPDSGIWEMRGEPRHFVQSKAMCWVALDRGLRLAKECLRPAPERRWRRVRGEIRASVEEHGYDKRRGSFVQAYGSTDLDASLLLLPIFGFVGWSDERMVRTTDAIRDELDDGGLLRRYVDCDGTQGREGSFIACSFWLVECLAHQGRRDDARAVFEQAVATRNDLGLFSEEFDTQHNRMLGNYPQGLTHLSHIAAAVSLQETSRARSDATRASRSSRR